MSSEHRSDILQSNMSLALERICRGAGIDGHEARKLVAERLILASQQGCREVADFETIAAEIVAQLQLDKCTSGL
jgi:hypothetical protein